LINTWRLPKSQNRVGIIFKLFIMKKVLLFTAFAITLVLAISCHKSDVVNPNAQPKFNPIGISNSTNPVLTKTGCGGFEWKVNFTLAAPSQKGGWIVQQIISNDKIYNCDGTVAKNVTTTYWEAWEVAPGQSIPKSRANGTYNYDDDYFEKDHGCTKGNIEIDGKVKFFEGLALPATFKMNNPATMAGSLPSTTEVPAFWNNDATVSHKLSTTWNCCDLPNVQSINTIPIN
jgi:hypothetical protein